MTDKNIPWTGDFHLGAGEPTTPAEKAFLRDAERIAEEVAGMTDADVADYLVEHNLQDLVAPERVDTLVASALEGVRQRRQNAVASDTPSQGPSFAVRTKNPGSDGVRNEEKLSAGGNVVRPVFGPRRDPAR
jgi:hypothetical protein